MFYQIIKYKTTYTKQWETAMKLGRFIKVMEKWVFFKLLLLQI